MSDKPIRFTKHARQKVVDLEVLGFTVREEQVIDTLRNPDQVDRESIPPIAQKGIDADHVLRVVFVEEDEEIRVITLYPGRRTRYETDDAL
jgi:hypothetical protein